MKAFLKDVYAQRFSEADAAAKDAIWREIGAFLQRYVPRDGAVLDIGCDRGDFIRNVSAEEKWATDLRDVGSQLPRDVHFVQANGLEIDQSLPHDHFDVVFMSNYLEHLPGGEAVIEQLRVARTLLKPGGRAVVLQPNVRLVGPAYWDFIDHSAVLTDRSLVEAAELAGLRTTELIVRFLPYTTKSRLPQSPWLVRAYLGFRPAWRLLGKQTLYVGTKIAVEETGPRANESPTRVGQEAPPIRAKIVRRKHRPNQRSG